MSEFAIIAEHVQVSYPLGTLQNIGLKEYVLRRIKKDYTKRRFVAVKDVTFSINKGDMLGVLGSNGAGKSTLLKVIAGVIHPTRGHMRVNGNVAALLELSTGFDGSMTVKENVYLRGAMLGYSKAFLDAKYTEIIDFSELGEFQDFMFRQLSSGMRSRLAFSIACLIEPEIVILDEVLSVGDGAFRKKSEAKMLEVLGGGVTTVFVSHSTDQVSRLCNKVLWIERGEQIAFGDDVKGICEEYSSAQDAKA